MASILGSLLVELKANTAEFLTGMRGASLAAQKAGKEIAGALGPVGDVVKNLGSTFASMGGAVAGLTAVGGALFAAAGHAAEMGNKV